MKYTELLERLQKLTDTKISQKNIADLLEVGASAISNKVARNTEFTLEENEQVLNVKTGEIKKNENPDMRYEVSFVRPFDMFAQTKHVETLVVLSRKK